MLTLIDAHDRTIAGEDADELRATDFVTAGMLAERFDDELAGSVAERAAADREWTYGHLVVDEAQELSAMDWHVLARRCPSRSITAVGDLAQRSAPAGARTWAEVLAPIAGDRFTLRALTVNYRTPAEIMEAAALALPEDERHRVPQSVRRTGEPPIHARLDELAGLVDGRGTAAVITADPAALPTLDGFVVHSPGSAKGLEFDVVAVVDPEAIRAACPADLYVAMTRATRRLVLVPGAQSSSASIRAAVRGAVGLHGDVVDGGVERAHELLGDPLRVRGGVLHAPPGPVPPEPVGHVHLLLEVVGEREVEEGPPRGHELHRRGQPALHHGDVARRQLAVQLGHVAADLHARRHGHRGRVDPRPAHHHHPQLGDLLLGVRERVGDAAQQRPADPRPADGHHAHALVGPVAQPLAQGLPVGHRRRTGDVTREREVRGRPLPHAGQARPERVLDEVVGVADEDRPVAHPRVAGDLLDHLGVVVGGERDLGRAAVGHRQPADEVGEPGERAALELRVLVQEVVDVPALVGDHEVEVLLGHEVVEDHEVGDQDLVHAPVGLEDVQVVLARLRLHVRRLPGQQRPTPGARSRRARPAPP